MKAQYSKKKKYIYIYEQITAFRLKKKRVRYETTPQDFH